MEKVIVFGASKNGLRIKRDLESLGGISVNNFCDNNIKKQGCKLDEIEIISFTQVVQMCQEGNCDSIIISLIEPEKVVDQIRDSNIKVEVYGATREYLFRQHDRFESVNQFLYTIDVSKPRLDYFEYHVAHHCNLKCKGCGHYSNIAKPEFGNLEMYKKDIQRLKELYWGVGRIRLMGGEPLLNKELPEFIISTREIFPDANIRVVTNGLLIPCIDKKVLKTMNEYYIGFDITQYPPTSEIKEKIEIKCIENNVEFSLSPLVKEFFNIRNIDGNSDKTVSYEKCISKGCHFLQDGKISVCGAPILYNKYKDLLEDKIKIYDEDIIDIYCEDLDGFILNERMSKPINTCKYCDNVNMKWFDWQGNYPYLD